MRKKLRLGLLSLLLAGASGVQAGELWCLGMVSHVFVEKSGVVQANFSFRGDYLGMCSLKKDVWGTADPTVCMAWLSQLRSAVARKSSVLVYYDGATSANSCEALPYYTNAPTPGYIMNVD